LGSVEARQKREAGRQAFVVVLVASVCACGLDDRDPGLGGPQMFGNPFAGQGNGVGQGGSSGASGTSSMAAAGSAPLGSGGATAPVGPVTMTGNGGSAPGTGGSGTPGMGGAGGGASSDCTMSPVGCMGMGAALTPWDGWVDAETNGLGIQGSFFVASDADGGGSSTVTPSFMGADICVSGVAAQIGVDAQGIATYARDWGVAVGFTLAQSEEDPTPLPWSRSTLEGSVIGFSFALTGPIIPGGLRFVVQGTDVVESYCGAVFNLEGARQDMLFAGLESECWNPGLGATMPADTRLNGLQWSITTNEAASVPFDFCIFDLRAILE
jgi:hypothetical protein